MDLARMVNGPPAEAGAGSGPAAVTPTSSKADVKLARKRARDRRAQQAMRDRHKGQLDALRDQVAALSGQLRAVGVASNGCGGTSLVASPPNHDDENTLLRHEIENLRRELQLARGSQPPSATVGLSPTAAWKPSSKDARIDSAILASWAEQSSSWATSPSTSMLSRRSARSTSFSSPIVLSDRVDMPWHLPASCPADRIMQTFFEEKREFVKSLALKSTSNPTESIRASTCKVAADLLSTYMEIDTLPKKVACLYIITSVLNWLILQSREAFEDMPIWLRPCTAQLEIPHPAWMDRVQWPRVREYLVRHQDITFDEYADAFSLSFEVNWPYDYSLVILKDSTPDTGAVNHRLNPVFEEHIKNLYNWTTGPRYWQIYPVLAKLVNEDRHQFGNPSPYSNS